MNVTFKKGNRFVATPIEKANREPSLPSLPRMAMNVAAAGVRTARSVATGNPINVSPETAAKRQAICEGCEHLRRSDKRCAKCGCPTSTRGLIANKTELFAEFCPSGKWGPGDQLN